MYRAQGSRYNTNSFICLQTIVVVTGCIEPKEAGITLVHEHLCCNASALCLKPKSDKYADYCDRPLTQDIGWWITHNP